jgi:hypothetical protein
MRWTQTRRNRVGKAPLGKPILFILPLAILLILIFPFRRRLLKKQLDKEQSFSKI